jgi:hypothetical protein
VHDDENFVEVVMDLLHQTGKGVLVPIPQVEPRQPWLERFRLSQRPQPRTEPHAKPVFRKEAPATREGLCDCFVVTDRQITEVAVDAPDDGFRENLARKFEPEILHFQNEGFALDGELSLERLELERDVIGLRLAPDAGVPILDGKLASLLVELDMEKNIVGEAIDDMEVKARLLIEGRDGETKRAREPLDNLYSFHGPLPVLPISSSPHAERRT